MLIKLDGVNSASEALYKSGMNWSVEQSELMTSDGKWVESHKALHRSDTGNILGVVGRNYQPIQNHEAFAFFDVIAERYGASYETAGIIKGGKKIFLQAKLGDSFEVGAGDQVDSYITLVTSHDGSSSLRAFMTPIRLWCQNQLNNAIKNSSTNVMLRHTANVEMRIQDALEVFNMSSHAFDIFKQKSQYLANKLVDKRKVERFLDSIVEDTGSTRSQNQRDKIVQLFESGKGNFGNTAWELYNGATEWVDHARSSDSEKALDSAMFGSGAVLKGKAFEAAMTL